MAGKTAEPTIHTAVGVWEALSILKEVFLTLTLGFRR
jgi:hypothetical protein